MVNYPNYLSGSQDDINKALKNSKYNWNELALNYLNDLVMYNVVSQEGHNKFNLIETYRISEADRSAINSMLLLKKKNVTDSSSFYLLTGGNEQKLKVYV